MSSWSVILAVAGLVDRKVVNNKPKYNLDYVRSWKSRAG